MPKLLDPRYFRFILLSVVSFCFGVSIYPPLSLEKVSVALMSIVLFGSILLKKGTRNPESNPDSSKTGDSDGPLTKTRHTIQQSYRETLQHTLQRPSRVCAFVFSTDNPSTYLMTDISAPSSEIVVPSELNIFFKSSAHRATENGNQVRILGSANPKIFNQLQKKSAISPLEKNQSRSPDSFPIYFINNN